LVPAKLLESDYNLGYLNGMGTGSGTQKEIGLLFSKTRSLWKV